jgi:hypothetical protein
LDLGEEINLTEELLEIIRVVGTGFAPAHEDLFLTKDKVIIARLGGGRQYIIGGIVMGILIDEKDKEVRKISAEDILKADKNNYAIPYSEITKVELKKNHGIVSFQIQTKEKKRNWYALGIHEKDGAEDKDVIKLQLFDFEKRLRPILGGKLSITY